MAVVLSLFGVRANGAGRVYDNVSCVGRNVECGGGMAGRERLGELPQQVDILPWLMV